MGLLIFNLVLGAFTSFYLFASAEYGPTVGLISGCFWALQLVGAFLCDSKSMRAVGFTLVCIGVLPFLPLGALGIIGAGRMIRAAKAREEFDA